jgi:hypothetical protein
MVLLVLPVRKCLLPAVGKGCDIDLVILKTTIAPVPDYSSIVLCRQLDWRYGISLMSTSVMFATARLLVAAMCALLGP